jgi:hypothetical protein
MARGLALTLGELGHANAYETQWPDVYRYVHTDLSAMVKASMDSMLSHGWLKPRQSGTAPGGPKSRSQNRLSS